MALSRVVSEIFNVEKYRDLEIGIRGHSRSLKVVPFVRSSMVSYLSLKCTVCEIFDLQNAVTLKTALWVRQGHWKCHHVIEHVRLPIDVL